MVIAIGLAAVVVSGVCSDPGGGCWYQNKKLSVRQHLHARRAGVYRGEAAVANGYCL